MASRLTIPVTLEKQRALLRSSTRSLLSDNLDCSPRTSRVLLALKQNASDIGDSPRPHHVKPFLDWRGECINCDLAVLEKTLNAYEEAILFYQQSEKTREQHLEEVKRDIDELVQEKTVLLSQSRFLEEDISDTIGTVEEAYIKELQISFHEASQNKAKALKQPFKTKVLRYLDAQQNPPGRTEYYCNVLASWVSAGDMKCAHIVPFSFDVKELSYMFGAEEAALQSPRNGLMLHKSIEAAFDNGYVAIVPHGSLQATPTEWKLVILKHDMTNHQLWQNPRTNEITRWMDIDGRKLSFLNDNRPARRYLYMRYALAWLNAERQGYENFKVKVPPGAIWASPDKPPGYLRKSILRNLARKVGDHDGLPADFIEAGEFEDPDTASRVRDEIGKLNIPLAIRKHLDGERDEKEKDDDDDDDEEVEEADDD